MIEKIRRLANNIRKPAAASPPLGETLTPFVDTLELTSRAVSQAEVQ